MEETIKADVTDYEVVDAGETDGADYSAGYDIVAVVESTGVISTNFSALIPAVKKAMEKYRNIEVTESNLNEEKAELAKLRKAKTALKNEWKRVESDFNKPIELSKAQCKELLSVIEEAETSLDNACKEIEDRLKQQRYNDRAEYVENKIHSILTEDEAVFLRHCDPSWTLNPKWENKTYTEKQLKDDAVRIAGQVHNAWTMFEGTYRQQMLDVFAKTGDIGAALQEEKRLQLQAEQYAAAERIRAEREASEKERLEQERQEAQNKYNEVSGASKIQIEVPEMYNEPSIVPNTEQSADAQTACIQTQESAETVFTKYLVIRDMTVRQFGLLKEFLKANGFHGSIYNRKEDIV